MCVPICVHVNLNSFNYVNVYLIICSGSVDAAKLMAAQATSLGEYEDSLFFDCSDVHKMVDLYTQGGRSQLPTPGVTPKTISQGKKITKAQKELINNVFCDDEDRSILFYVVEVKCV